MFERFTDRARRVIVLAQEEARELGHEHVGTEHMLLGLLREGDGLGGRTLASFGVDLVAVRQQVIDAGAPRKAASPRQIPFTPRAKKVLELSLREALQLGHSYIGTEHILLGLVSEGDGLAAKILVGLGVELSEVRDRVLDLVAAEEDAAGHKGPLRRIRWRRRPATGTTADESGEPPEDESG